MIQAIAKLHPRVTHDHRSFLFLLGSSRPGGNTEALARRAAAQLPAAVRQRWIHLGEVPLPRFEDKRHVNGHEYAAPAGNEQLLLEATLEATDLVIASPLYWYSVSAATKLYLDHWSGWLRLPGAGFRERMRGRTLWAVSAIGGEDAAKADPLVGTLRYTAEYMGMRWGGALLGNANRPGDITGDADALAAAKVFFTG
jgi:multimeric flavodoxin WrbA